MLRKHRTERQLCEVCVASEEDTLRAAMRSGAQTAVAHAEAS